MRQPSDLQIEYQKNMLYGLLGSFLFCAILAIFLNTLSQGFSPTDSFGSGGAGPYQLEPTSKLGASGSNRGFQALFEKYINRSDGFLGFIRLEPVIATYDDIDIKRPTSKIGTPGLEYDETEFGSGGGSGSIGNSDGFYFDNGPFLAEIEPGLISRAVQISRHFDPDYPEIASESNMEGEIVVLVYIDSLGNLSRFPDWISSDKVLQKNMKNGNEQHVFEYAIWEKEVGWFFADELLAVLPQWKFIPRIELGQAVPSLLRIKYFFCLGENCEKVQFEQLTNINSTNLN